MGTRTSHPPGTLSWAELATPDPDSAKPFYTEVFGWSYDDLPAGNGIYTMAIIDGHQVAAMMTDTEHPPHWNNYVSVTSVDETAAKVTELGGTVCAPPFDVMQAGRMTVFADPQGAMLSAWEAGSHTGAGLVNAPGAMTWNDLLVPDPEGVEGFYNGVFGWTFEPAMPGQYWTIKLGERMNGGVARLDPERMPDAPPSWTPYFGHPDVEALAGGIADLGGELLFPIMPMPEGKIGWFVDPQGAVFAAWTGRYED